MKGLAAGRISRRRCHDRFYFAGSGGFWYHPPKPMASDARLKFGPLFLDLALRCFDRLVPNSTFLENSVTNLTYSSKNVQSTISVGVAYGSCVRRVTQLLLEAAEEHGLAGLLDVASIVKPA